MSSQEHSEEISGQENELLTDAETAKPSKRKLCDEKEAIIDSSEINKRRKSADSQGKESSDNNTVKIETADAEATDEIEPSSNSILVAIKTEPAEEHEDSGVPAASTSSNVPPAISIKTEAANGDAVAVTEAASSSTVVKTEPTNSSQCATVDSSVSSSTLRPSCRFGIRCYRRNPAHRNTEAHPGDSDYRRPSYPTPPLGTPACQFGNSCYRRNPVHFQQFSHPSDFNSAQNIRNRLRQRRAQTQNSNARADEYSDFESDEEEDPFNDDSDLDYKPGANEDKDDDDDEDDELEFNSERQNCDEFD